MIHVILFIQGFKAPNITSALEFVITVLHVPCMHIKDLRNIHSKNRKLRLKKKKGY